VQAVLHEPICAATAAKAFERIEAIFSNAFAAKKPERCADSLLIVTGWFRKRSEEKPKLLSRRQAANLCRTMMESAGATG